MTLTLPPELAGLLEQAGGHWPEADEDQLHQLAGSWRTLAGNLRTLGAEGTATARSVADEHHGESIDAFSSYWREFERNVDEGATAAEQTAEAVDTMARATLGAKSSIVDGLSAAFSQVLARGTSHVRRHRRNRPRHRDHLAFPWQFHLADPGGAGQVRLAFRRLALQEDRLGLQEDR